MFLMTLTTLLMSITFMLMNHPLSAGVILLIQTISISMITGNLNQNFWFSYMLFLIMIGGMLILFMYMTSVASNEKFKLNMKMIIIIPMTLTITWVIEPKTLTFMKNNEIMIINTHLNNNMLMSKYMSMPLVMTLLFMMMYLLMALIIVVKMTSFKQGSIRQMN